MGMHRKHKRRATTTEDYAAMLARMLRAYGPRIGQEPAAGLAALRELETELTAAANVGLYLANRDGGHSASQLAAHLGIAKQSAWQRIKAGEAAWQRRQRRQAPALQRAAPRQPRQLPPA